MSEVAIFLDLESVLRVLEERTPARSPDVEGLLLSASRYGRVTVRRAYGDWSDPKVRALRTELTEHGFDLVQTPTLSSRNRGAEIRLVVDAIELLFTHNHLTHFVFASCEPEMSCVLQRIREHGKQTILLAPRVATTTTLRAAADIFIPSFEGASEARPKENPPLMEEDRRPKEGRPVPIGPHRRIRLHGTAIPLFTAEIRQNVIDALYEAFQKSDGVDVRAATVEVAQKANGGYDQYIVERIQQTLYYAKAFTLRGGMHDAVLSGDISSADDLHRRYDRHLAVLLAEEYPSLHHEDIAELLAEDPRQANYIRDLLSEPNHDPSTTALQITKYRYGERIQPRMSVTALPMSVTEGSVSVTGPLVSVMRVFMSVTILPMSVTMDCLSVSSGDMSVTMGWVSVSGSSVFVIRK
jgi:hypothetical protein